MAIEYIYVMPVEGIWSVRVPGRLEVSEHGNFEDAMAAAREFAWLRRSLGRQSTPIRVRMPDGQWREVDGEGATRDLHGSATDGAAD